MNKINFVNNSEPALSAENLNQMQNNMEEAGVVVSPTEPTTNEKVWIQKGKNLFNKNNAIKGFWVDSSNGNLVLAEDYNMVSEIISVLPNTKYTLSGISGVASNGTAWVTILSYSKEKTFNTMIFDNATLGTTFTTGENDYYIRVAIGNISLTTVQLEQGSTATEYEEYIEKKIYCKNDNGVYIPFVPENKPINITTGVEFETGRIIDGKKEYGKRIDCGNLPNATEKIIAHGVSFSQITRFEGLAVGYGSSYIPLPYAETNENSSYNVKLVINENYIVVKSEKDQSVFHGYVTMYYTKN